MNLTKYEYSECPLERAYEYAEHITDGTIISCKYVKQAVQRFQADLNNPDYYFDEKSALTALNSFYFFKHSKGEFAGNPIYLEPWQCFLISQVFGWKRTSDDIRKYRTVYTEVARKNGKSTLMAGIALFMMVKDSEASPEIFTAATKKDQARIVFDEARRMVNQSPALSKRLTVQQHAILNPNNFGKFVALANDSNSLDGLNPSCVVIDELHAHKTDATYNVLLSAMGARKQPLLWSITTAGFNKNGPAYNLRIYAMKVLAGVIEDPYFYPMIFSLDEDDDWADPVNFIKSNPNLDISVSSEYLGIQLNQAKNIPGQKTNFLTKHLNVWVSGDNLWCNTEKWALCGQDYNYLKEEPVEVYLGLDLSSVSDITALVGVMVMPDGEFKIFCKTYLPEQEVKTNIRKNPFYMEWAQAKYLTLTSGNTVDYDFIKHDILELLDRFNVMEIAYDRWNSSSLVSTLKDEGAPMVQFGQGYASISPAMKELERLYLAGNITHDKNPVLSWAMANVVVQQDPAGNIKAAKDKSSNKIDPAVALIMAVGRASVVTDDSNAFNDYINNPVQV